MQRDACHLRTRALATLQSFTGEVKAGGGGGDRAALAIEHSLVAFTVRSGVGTADVGRQGHVAQAVEIGVDIFFAQKAQGSFAPFAPCHDLRGEGVGKMDDLSGLQFAARSHQSPPCARHAGHRFQQQDFHGTAARLAMPREARWNHPGIVHHQAIAFPQVRGEVAECAVLPLLCFTVQNQHACAIAGFGRLLRDEFVGQSVVEVRKVHEKWDDVLIVFNIVFNGAPLINVRLMVAALAFLPAGVYAAALDPVELKSTQALEQALAAKNPETRKLAAVSLSLAGENEALEMTLVKLLDDKDVEVRLAVIASLSDLHNKRATDALEGAMNDAAPEVSFAAAKALWGLKIPIARNALLSVLEGESKSSSGVFGEKKRQALRMMHTPRTTFLTALRGGVGFIPMPGLGEGISSMQSLLGDPGLSGRASAALLLGADTDPRTLEALKDALRDKTWSVRAAAVHSLALHNDPALKAAIAPLVDDQNEAVKLRAAAGYLRLRAIEQRPKPVPAAAPKKKL